MSIKDFQTFIASDPQLQNSPFGPCVRVVNLLHLHDPSIPYGFGPMQAAFAAAAQRRQAPMGRNNVAQLQRMGMVPRGSMPIQPIIIQNRVALVLDAESCLDRLYGGFFPGNKLGHSTVIGRTQLTGSWKKILVYSCSEVLSLYPTICFYQYRLELRG